MRNNREYLKSLLKGIEPKLSVFRFFSVENGVVTLEEMHDIDRVEDMNIISVETVNDRIAWEGFEKGGGIERASKQYSIKNSTKERGILEVAKDVEKRKGMIR